ncbi:hypothetical protein D770_06770 [Flammeovirgaceae bacterium 311]|nr:hypothetical protein D770_06770 [Flammeovirgaceae bacterium 311]
MKTSYSFLATLMALGMAFSVSCSHPEDLQETPNSPGRSSSSQKWASGTIPITIENLFPEGLEYDKQMKRFLVGSFTQGTIGFVEEGGAYTKWIDDPDIPSTTGIHIDLPRKRLLVAVADLGLSTKSSESTAFMLAGLAAYDLRSGERLFYTRLDALLPGMPHFANDVTVDQQGNAYVTDSFTGAIYKVDTDGNASVFYMNEALSPAPGGFGLNGIEYDSRGYLLVSKLDENLLLRFPIDDPAAYSQISVPVALNGPDGLTLKNNNELVVVNNDFGGEQGNIITLRSKDMWQSAEVSDVYYTGATFPASAAIRPGGDVFVLNSYLHVLIGGGTQPRFEIVEVR